MTYPPHRMISLMFAVQILIILIVLLSISNAHGARIFGTVTDAETSEPIEDADVVVSDKNDRNNTQKTVTDSQGDYEVNVATGDYWIFISKEGYEDHKGEESVALTDVQHDAELIPDEETWLEGYVTDNSTGDPIAGAEVALYARSSSDKRDDKGDDKAGPKGTTDRLGRYNISCDNTSYSIEISHQDYEDHYGRITTDNGGNEYDASLDPVNSSTDRPAKPNDGNSTDDSGSGEGFFWIAGADVIMLSGWIVAIMLIVVILMKRRGRKPEALQTDKPMPIAIEGTKASPPPGGSESCPKCGASAVFYPQYGKHYCQSCKGYF